MITGGRTTVTAAVPVFPPCVAVAVTVHAPGELGAVYMPPLVMVPQLADQVTRTLAVNCCVPPTRKVTLLGVTLTEGGGGGAVIVTVALARFPLPLAAVAVTVHVPGVFGAVYVPSL